MTERTIELDCAGLDVRSPSIQHGRGGGVFRCTLSPVSPEMLEALDTATQSEATLRLVFSQRPLVLERIEVTRVERHGVHLVGRVVED